MKITVEWLKEKSACCEGIGWFAVQRKTGGIEVLKILIKQDKLHWANWLICRLMDKPQQVKYAVFAALQVIKIFEKKYPKDKRPRKAIEAAQAWLKNPCDETRNAAAYAAADAAAYAAAAAYAYAANAAAYAAAAAAYAAAAAAYADAAAAYAANADAAYAANADAAADDAKKKLQLKILVYGMRLLK